MNAKELFDKYADTSTTGRKSLSLRKFTRALAEVISLPVEAEVKQAACGKWQKMKPTKPCYFVHRDKKNDDYPQLYEAIIDTEILCVANIQDDEFVCTMEEFVDDGEFYIIEK